MKRAMGQKVIAKIEQFQRDQGRLPSSLAEIGIRETESGPIYYEKKEERRYIVWYGTTLGESVTYISEIRKWDDRP